MIIGTETEYGITIRRSEGFDPVSSSLFLINSYPPSHSLKILWDYDNENPLADARGFEVKGEKGTPDPDNNRALNKLLPNGGRLYVDGAHPEYSTPECSNPREVVRYEKAGERIIESCLEFANRIRGKEEEIFLYKNNTDGKGNSYGYHENYLLPRSIPFEKIMEQLIPFLVTRQIYCGAGKTGAENRAERVDYQISQRADFFETLVDLNTMVKRPIINTRDEPHADAKKYRRLHIIVGDTNMSEYTTYLKVGTTSIVLRMIEDGFIEGSIIERLTLEDPVRAIKEVSHDPTCKKKVNVKGGRSLTPIEIQKEYLELAHVYFSKMDIDPISKDILAKWGYVLDRLEEDPRLLSKEIDWVIKLEMIESYMNKKSWSWKDSGVSMLDLQYHDIRREKGLYHVLERGGYVERIIEPGEIKDALENPPIDTRAYFRGACLKRYPRQIYAASWSSIIFDAGPSALKKIPLMEPSKGTRKLVGNIMEESNTVEDLLAKVSA